MKTAISIPDKLFKQAEREAKRLNLTRSRLFQMALEAHFQKLTDQDITASLNHSYGMAPDAGDALLTRAARQTMTRVERDDAKGRDMVGRSRRTKRLGAGVQKASGHRLGK